MLSSLHISNFRSLQNLNVPRLGRLNLIVGNNNSGKSSVLEALRIYAGNANRTLLERISGEHDETIRLLEQEPAGDSENILPFEAFFSGRKYPQDDNSAIQIGEREDHPDSVRIRHGFLVETEEVVTDPDGNAVSRIIRREISKQDLTSISEERISQALFINKSDKGYRLRFDMALSRMRNLNLQEIPLPTPCGYVPTRFVSAAELAEEWDKIVLTENEKIILKALRIINPEFEGLAFVSDEEVPNRNRRERIAKVRLANSPRPVPLNSMGDGMLRILQLVLKVFSAKGGFLLVDEFENGFHYSIQEQVWDLLFELAERLDIQVFATTHSWDCIKAFSRISAARTESEGVLFRVGRSVRNSDRGQVIATVFKEDELVNITQSDVEVR